MTQFILNQIQQNIDAEPDVPLLWVVREIAGLTGTKFGCGQAMCGACTVLLDGQPIRSCQTMLGDVAGRSVTTIEGASGRVAEAVQKASVRTRCATMRLLPIGADPRNHRAADREQIAKRR